MVAPPVVVVHRVATETARVGELDVKLDVELDDVSATASSSLSSSTRRILDGRMTYEAARREAISSGAYPTTRDVRSASVPAALAETGTASVPVPVRGPVPDVVPGPRGRDALQRRFLVVPESPRGDRTDRSEPNSGQRLRESETGDGHRLTVVRAPRDGDTETMDADGTNPRAKRLTERQRGGGDGGTRRVTRRWTRGKMRRRRRTRPPSRRRIPANSGVLVFPAGDGAPQYPHGGGHDPRASSSSRRRLSLHPRRPRLRRRRTRVRPSTPRTLFHDGDDGPALGAKRPRGIHTRASSRSRARSRSRSRSRWRSRWRSRSPPSHPRRRRDTRRFRRRRVRATRRFVSRRERRRFPALAPAPRTSPSPSPRRLRPRPSPRRTSRRSQTRFRTRTRRTRSIRR